MNQETRVDWWHYTFTSTSWRMTENHSNVVAAAQFFKNYCKYYTQAWLVQMPPTSMCPEARGVPWASPVPWWHMTALAVLGARDLPQLCYVTRQLQLSKSTLEGYEMFCFHSWWIFWCYCCYVWSDAMCTFPYKLLFLLEPELSHLLLSQEETPSNTRLIPSKGSAVAEKALPGHKHIHRHTWSHHASKLSQPML